MTNDEYLLFKAAQWAFNDIPNRPLTHSVYRNTYALASAIDRMCSSHEEEMNGNAVCERNTTIGEMVVSGSILPGIYKDPNNLKC